MFRIVLEHDGQNWHGWTNWGEAEVLICYPAERRVERFIAPIFPALDGPPGVDGTAQRAGAPRD